MSRLLVSTAWLLLLLPGTGSSQTAPTKPPSKSPYLVELPIPAHLIPCDLSLWRGSFSITRVAYDREANQVVFLLKALRDFKVTDDGFESIKFFDEDNVDLIQKKNVKIVPDATQLKRGEATRARMDVPEVEILRQTRRAAAVASGFFMK
jgi:hypothetical protein